MSASANSTHLDVKTRAPAMHACDFPTAPRGRSSARSTPAPAFFRAAAAVPSVGMIVHHDHLTVSLGRLFDHACAMKSLFIARRDDHHAIRNFGRPPNGQGLPASTDNAAAGEIPKKPAIDDSYGQCAVHRQAARGRRR